MRKSKKMKKNKSKKGKRFRSFRSWLRPLVLFFQWKMANETMTLQRKCREFLFRKCVDRNFLSMSAK